MRTARIRPRVVRLRLRSEGSLEEQIQEACQALSWITGGEILMTRVHWTDRPDVMELLNFYEFHEVLTWSGYPNRTRAHPEVTHRTCGRA